MKNTAKKILALIFAVAMICTLAVPAFAADETSTVYVTVVNYDGDTKTIGVEVSNKTLNVEKAIKEFNDELLGAEVAKYDVSFNSTTGLVKLVGTTKLTDEQNLFGTGAWTVAVNGKTVTEDLGTVAVAEDYQIVVYWADTTFGTKLAQVDFSKIAQGIVSFYYNNADGTTSPVKSATVTMSHGPNTDLIDNELSAHAHNDSCADTCDIKFTTNFTTDEKGQIWIAPADLESGLIQVESISIKKLAKIAEENEKYDDDERAFYNANLTRNFEDAAVVGQNISVNDIYNVAGSTGDMTMVYVLVAAAAIVTLAAVVVLKKKAVKAN